MIKPLGKNVTVLLTEKKKVSDGGILIPDSVRENSDNQLAIVKGVGDEVKEGTLKEDDQVILSTSFAHQAGSFEGYVVVPYDAILGIVESK